MMLFVSLLLASALVVTQDGTELRAGCEPGGSIVGTASAGATAEIRFSMVSSAGRCFKISVVSEGKTLEGYVSASALSSTEEFDAGVRSAPALTLSRPSTPAPVTGSSVALGNTSANPLIRASALIEQKQPAAALEIVEQGMKIHGRGYQFLVLAGIAAQASDQPRLALDYLREAQQQHQDHSVEQLIARLEKEVGGDKSGEKLFGNRFVLRYEGGVLNPEVARSMIALLEQEFSRIASELGCRTDERIATIVQSRMAYRASSSAAEWSGGHFDGSRIHVPIGEDGTISDQTRDTFAHELVHACLANLGTWPAWLHEGLAQKLTGRIAADGTRRKIEAMLHTKRLPRLENMSQSWSRMSGEHAMIAYQYALVAVEVLYEMYSGFGIQNVLRAPERLADVTARIDKQLAR
jgi:hypothetical protein